MTVAHLFVVTVCLVALAVATAAQSQECHTALAEASQCFEDLRDPQTHLMKVASADTDGVAHEYCHCAQILALSTMDDSVCADTLQLATSPRLQAYFCDFQHRHNCDPPLPCADL